MPDRKAQHHDPSTTPAQPLTRERSARTRSGAPASAAAARTSATDPLRIDEVAAPAGGGGRIGMTFCPGKRQRGAAMGDWERDLAADLARVAEWDAAAIATLMEPHELERYGVAGLGEAVEARGWSGTTCPSPTWASRIACSRRGGSTPAIGSGRTSSPVARCCSTAAAGSAGQAPSLPGLLVELGTAPGHAVAEVRRARPGAIETAAQEAYVRAAEPVDAAQAASADRLLGCLLGGALGDAFGYAVEFDSLEAIRRRFGPEGIREPVFHAGRLVVSDDTQMTLFTLEGLLRAVGPDGAGPRRASSRRCAALTSTGSTPNRGAPPRS